MPRWICPRCEGVKIAPQRPRRDDSRRYCLPCSDTTGRLVERTCPVLDKAREERGAKAAEAKAKANARAEAKAKAKLTWAGVDLGEWATRIIALKRWTSKERASMRTYEIRLRRCKREPTAQIGYCSYVRGWLSVSVWPQRSLINLTPRARRGRSAACALETLIHELVHAAGYRNHGHEFRSAMRDASAELAGSEIPVGNNIWDEALTIRAALAARYPELLVTEDEGKNIVLEAP